MKTISVPIINALDIPRVNRYEVVNFIDNDMDENQNAIIQIRLFGPGAQQYGGIITLVAHDTLASTCLQKNTTQQGYEDLFSIFGKVVAGAYTTLSAAYNANIATPTKRKRLLAVEASISILLGPEFATT